jgi:hypothetical protein
MMHFATKMNEEVLVYSNLAQILPEIFKLCVVFELTYQCEWMQAATTHEDLPAQLC